MRGILAGWDALDPGAALADADQPDRADHRHAAARIGVRPRLPAHLGGDRPRRDGRVDRADARHAAAVPALRRAGGDRGPHAVRPPLRRRGHVGHAQPQPADRAADDGAAAGGLRLPGAAVDPGAQCRRGGRQRGRGRPRRVASYGGGQRGVVGERRGDRRVPACRRAGRGVPGAQRLRPPPGPVGRARRVAAPGRRGGRRRPAQPGARPARRRPAAAAGLERDHRAGPQGAEGRAARVGGRTCSTSWPPTTGRSSPSCASWPAASTRRCSPSAVSSPPCSRRHDARRCR